MASICLVGGTLRAVITSATLRTLSASAVASMHGDADGFPAGEERVGQVVGQPGRIAGSTFGGDRTGRNHDRGCLRVDGGACPPLPPLQQRRGRRQVVAPPLVDAQQRLPCDRRRHGATGFGVRPRVAQTLVQQGGALVRRPSATGSQASVGPGLAR
ncbi:hypothetical protein DIPPA_15459 [Diplonema papillatum]|nr:hypothetical protein DIPPA_15459 [Diplonema papillatum]